MTDLEEPVMLLDVPVLTTKDILTGAIALIDKGLWEPDTIGYCDKPGCALGLVHMAAGLDENVKREYDNEMLWSRDYPGDNMREPNTNWPDNAMLAVELLARTAEGYDPSTDEFSDIVIQYNDQDIGIGGAEKAKEWFERAAELA